MTLARSEDGTVVLVGDCPSDDAEPLLGMLLDTPGVSVDLRGCQRAHAAVIQVLLASQAELVGPAAGGFLRRWVEPGLRKG